MLFSRAISAPGNSPVSVYESCVSAAKCEKVSPPVFRFRKGGVKALGTSSVHLCDKKDSEIPSIQDEMTNPEKGGDPVDTDQPKMTEQQEKPVALKAVNKTVTEQQAEDKNEQVESKQTRVQTKAAKSDKKNLLELLAAMKVDVTSMSRRRKPQMTQTDEATAQLVNNVSTLQQAKKNAPLKSDSLDPRLVSAASAAASTLPNQKQAQSELLQQLLKRKAMTDAQRKAETNLGEIISDMKIGRSPNRQASATTSETLFDDDRKKYRRAITSELAAGQRRMILFSGKSLGIFSPPTHEDTVELTDAQPTLWDLDFEHQISQSVNQLPRNGIEEMIQWTKEGKMWLYPIDNEAGLEEEAKVPFHEHVFLEKHLVGFPRQGPVRHFMELVVAGLSRNPYLTVQQKKEHISWFKDYFNQKEEVLKEADISLN